MGETRHDGLAIPGRVVLAHEPPFRIGCLQIHPPTRQVVSAHERNSLEPRVMQVLVALARADGEVLTRDDLVDRCWDGRIVGDDAINRVISRLRHLGESSGDAFRIETIARVGYRLVEPEHKSRVISHEHEPAPDRHWPSRRYIVAGIGAAAGLAAAGAAAWMTLKPAYESSHLARLYFQRGMESRGQATLVNAEQAVAYFRQATLIDPQYAEAWGALAWGYRTLLEFGPRPDADSIALFAHSAARRALELDGDNADAHAALLLLRPFYRNWAEIERGCRELLARHPMHSISRYNLAHVLTETGRWRDSIPHFHELARNEPFWPLARMQLFRALRNGGRLEEAEAEIETASKRWPRREDIWSTRIRHLLLMGRSSDALALLEDPAAQPADNPLVVDLERTTVRAYVSGSAAERRKAVVKLQDLARSAPQALVPAIADCAMLGAVDSAFSMLEGFFFGRGDWSALRPQRPFTAFLFHSMTAPLRRDRRFQPLVDEIGLERYWHETGTQPDYRRFA